MGKPYPMALRERVVAFLGEGYTHRATAARFRVSVKCVHDMIILQRETGGLKPRPQGNGGGHGKLGRLQDWIRARMHDALDVIRGNRQQNSDSEH